MQQSADGTLRIDGEAIIDLNASTRVDVSGDLKVGGDIDLEGDIDVNGTLETDALTIGDVAITASNANRLTWDAVVDAGGGADYTTIQAGDDVLDAAAYTMWVKSATYGAGFTVSTNDALIQLEPGTVVQAAIILSGNDITLRVGAGCDIQGLVTMSGTGCSLICENGVDLDGILMSGASGLVDGGGLETHSAGGTAVDGINITGDSNTVKDIQVSGTSGSSMNGIEVAGDYNNIRNIYCSGAYEGVTFISGALHNVLDGARTVGCSATDVRTQGGATNNILNNIHCTSTTGSWSIGAGVYVSGGATVGSNWMIVSSGSSGSNAWTITGSNCALSNIRVNSSGGGSQVNISASNNIISGLSVAGVSTTNHIGFSGDNNYVSLVEQATSGSVSIIFNSGADYNVVSGTRGMAVNADAGTGNRTTNMVEN